MSNALRQVKPSPAAVLSAALAEAARRLGIRGSDLARIIGVSQPTASRLLAGTYRLKDGSKEWELATLLLRLYRSLHAIVGSRDDLVRSWLNSANRAFGEQRPIDVIRSAQGLVLACQYVDAHRAPL